MIFGVDEFVVKFAGMAAGEKNGHSCAESGTRMP